MIGRLGGTVSQLHEHQRNGETVDPKQLAEQAFTEVETDLAGLSRWMYENPEIGFEEHETSARLVEFLARPRVRR